MERVQGPRSSKFAPRGGNQEDKEVSPAKEVAVPEHLRRKSVTEKCLLKLTKYLQKKWKHIKCG